MITSSNNQLIAHDNKIDVKCEGQNFARRAECYRCGAPKKENAIFLSQNTSFLTQDSFPIAVSQV